MTRFQFYICWTGIHYFSGQESHAFMSSSISRPKD